MGLYQKCQEKIDCNNNNNKKAAKDKQVNKSKNKY